MKKINENQKVTLTLEQLKRLVLESNPENRDELDPKLVKHTEDLIKEALAMYDVYVLNNRVHMVLGMTGLHTCIDEEDVEKLKECENEINDIARKYGDILEQAITKKGYDYHSLWKDSYKLAEKLKRNH